MTTTDPTRQRAIAMIGGGQMALALAEGFCRAGLLAPGDIAVHDPHEPARERLAARVPGIGFVATGGEAAAAAPIVFLAVKPQQAAVACREVAAALGREAVLVSIVAGLSTTKLAALTGTRRIIRVMPNTPCLVGRGVSVVCGTPEVPTAVRDRVRALLGAVGHVHDVDESLMDAVTGLSGSGPGFVARFVEALAAGGMQAGLPEPLALALAIETLAAPGRCSNRRASTRRRFAVASRAPGARHLRAWPCSTTAAAPRRSPPPSWPRPHERANSAGSREPAADHPPDPMS